MASKHIWVLYEASIDFMCKLEANMASSKVKGRGGDVCDRCDLIDRKCLNSYKCIQCKKKEQNMMWIVS